jgi:UDP-glucose 4-epimerase
VTRTVTDDRPVNLAFGTRVSLLDVVRLLEQELGRSLEVSHTDPRPGDVRDSQADQAQLRFLFPDVQPVPLDLGLRATIDWFGP